eukprot:427742-Prorocentrum_minimum.AAC.4
MDPPAGCICSDGGARVPQPAAGGLPRAQPRGGRAVFVGAGGGRGRRARVDLGADWLRLSPQRRARVDDRQRRHRLRVSPLRPTPNPPLPAPNDRQTNKINK